MQTSIVKTRSVVLTALAALACAFATVAVGHAGAAFPGKNGKIAWADESSKNGIYTARANGSHQTRILSGNYQSPSFSATGHRLLATAEQPSKRGTIYLMRVNGKHKVRVPHTKKADNGATFSPNGKKIVFSRISRAGRQLYSIGIDGKNKKMLTHGHKSSGFRAVFSPNGKKIAFSRDCDLTIMDARGGHMKRLTNSVGGDCDGLADFSPNGKTIVFEHENSAGPSNVQSVSAMGGHRRTLVGGNKNSGGPVFSPDGNKVLFTRVNSPQSQQLMTMSPNGEHVKPLKNKVKGSGLGATWGASAHKGAD